MQLPSLFTLCHVLHRRGSQDIHCMRSIFWLVVVCISLSEITRSSFYGTDPTAGSPTVTLLRLLLPLDNVA